MINLNKTNIIIYNQLRNKLLYKNVYKKKFFRFINMNLNLFDLNSYKSVFLLESFFFMEFISNKKPFINYHKKAYNKLSIQLFSTMRNFHIYNFMYILNTFYFPIMIKRNLK